MKRMQYLVSLLLILTVSSTAYSQITGLSREKKVAIVSTIESYDAVVIEIDLTEQLLSQCKEINLLLRQQIIKGDELNMNLKAQIDSFNNQVGVQDKEIVKIKLKGKIGIGLGVAIGIAIGLILK